MCGIAGLISVNPDARVGAMLKAIEHRGRDDEGVWASAPLDEEGRRACFGHRRLAIIDTSSAGHQPMSSADGRYVVTFNGEIYNYRELRRRLASLGHEFQTDTDTEVLLKAFAQWGTNCLAHLNGMFAFAIWDEQERTLTLARDRLGIKPLFYAAPERADGKSQAFVFASEAKAILASGLVRAELDAEALNQQLTFLWTPDPHTLFRGIRRLPPAHLLTWRDGEVKLREWWDVSFDEVEEGRGEEWWRVRVLETLERVVGLEMVADVPLGSFLSGGVDSSVITALMKRHSGGRRVSTYTIGIEDEDLRYDIIPSDVPWARRVGKLLDSDYHEIMLKPDVAALLPALVRQLEMPVIDMAISSYLVSQKARETLTVMLSGMGGDEVFAGYPRQLAMSLAGALDPFPSALRRPAMRAVAGVLPGGMPGRLTAPLRNAKKFARSAALDFESRYLGFGTYFTDEAKQRLYTDEMREATEGVDAYYLHRRYFDRCSKAVPLNRLLYVDMKTFLPCLNLDYTDRTSMAATLEVRVPLINHELVELAARMPPRLKLRGLRRKYILKRAAESLLPREVVWRRKAGFGAPIRAWLRGPLRPLVDDLLSEGAVRRRGLFRPAEVRRVVGENLSGREDYNLQVLQLLTLEMWCQTFLDGQEGK
ncbi:MAG TPA: asparagine synthase (glutamine-hydrolyzing) [Pyrinomonadaceae bacterium]|jgi:asparagine synthase (glutamine-hydrolysing)|nr:asparagine synthase (glutamine-hydrolyzing) [Pyrinomonadaceae bacterium]